MYVLLKLVVAASTFIVFRIIGIASADAVTVYTARAAFNAAPVVSQLLVLRESYDPASPSI